MKPARPALIQLAACRGMKRSEERDRARPLISNQIGSHSSLTRPTSPSAVYDVRFTSMPRLGRWKLLCRNSRHDHPRHFRIKPTNSVAPDDKIGWIENVAFDEIKHRSINPRSLRLH
jgi:hypothetical protein